MANTTEGLTKRGEILQKLATASNAVRQKYFKLKQLNFERDKEQEHYLKPLIDPLEKIANQKFNHDDWESEHLENITQRELDKYKMKASTPKTDRSGWKKIQSRRKRQQNTNDSVNIDFSSTSIMNNPLDFRQQQQQQQQQQRKLADNNSDVEFPNFNEEIFETTSGVGEDMRQDEGDEARESIEKTVNSVLRSSDGNDLWREYSKNFGPISKKYMKKLFMGGKEKLDHRYGIRYASNHLMIGNARVELNVNDDIILTNNRQETINYKATNGLFELIIFNIPNDQIYTEEDLTKYTSILIHTSAARANYSELERLSGNNSYKYRQIIKPLLDVGKKNKSLLDKSKVQSPPVTRSTTVKKTKSVQARVNTGLSSAAAANLLRRSKSPLTSAAAVAAATAPRVTTDPKKKTSLIYKKSDSASVTKGSGLNKVFNTRVKEYVHWDNPNELVDRLRLLIASQEAGHTGHTNEIISILEELVEHGIISSSYLQ